MNKKENSMNELKLKKTLNVFAYAAVVFLGISLLLNYFNITTIFADMANIIAYIIISVFAFFYARTKRHFAYMIIYVISVLLILLMVILPFITQ